MSGINLKAIRVLKALSFGQEVEIDGRTYGFSEDNNLIVKGHKWASGKKPFVDQAEIIWLEADMSLSSFIKLCESISDDSLFILSAERALTEINRGKND